MFKKLFSSRAQATRNRAVQEWLQVQDVIGGQIVRVDGGVVAVLRVSPLNLALKSDSETETHIRALFEALNGQREPFQILSLPRAVDLNTYLDALRWQAAHEEDRRRKRLLRDYINHVAGIAGGGEATERRFYILLPHAGRMAAEEAAARAREFAAELGRAGLQVQAADDAEVFDLLFSFLHPAQAAFERPVEAYIPGLPGLRGLLAPAALDFTERQIGFGDLLARAMLVTEYPPRLGPAWLARASTLPGVVCSMHVIPTRADTLINQVNRTIGSLAGRLELGGNALSLQRAEQAMRDAEAMLRQIDQEQQNVFYITTSLIVLGSDQDQLDRRSRQAEAVLAATGLRARTALFRQQDALRAVGPWGLLPEDIRAAGARNMPAQTVAAAFPFTASGLNDGRGIVLGRDRDGGLVLVDVWQRGGDRTNSNWTVLAKPGAGKSFAVKTLLARELAQGTRVIIIDPEREYKHLCEALAGNWIDCAGDDAGRINPLQARAGGDDGTGSVRDHLQLLRTFFSLYLRDLTDLERAALESAVTAVYAAAGIGLDTDPAAVSAEQWPTVRDLCVGVEAEAETDPAWRRLAVLLARAGSGTDAALWAGPTTARAGANLAVLDVHRLQDADDAVRRAQFFNVLTWAWGEIERNRAERTLLVVDEAWLLADPQTPQALAFLRDASKRIRKYGGGLVVISQNIVDFLAPEVARYGQALIDNPTYKLLLAQGEKDLEALTKLMTLSDAERTLLETARRGEGLLVAGTQRVQVRIEAAPHEIELFGAGGGR